MGEGQLQISTRALPVLQPGSPTPRRCPRIVDACRRCPGCRRPAREAHAASQPPVSYGDYLRQQNARDPNPRLADVYERANALARPAHPSDNSRSPAPQPAPGAQPPTGDPARRLYGAPGIGDVTPRTVDPALAPPQRRAPIAPDYA